MSDDVTELKLRLEEGFSVATKLYQERGFQRRVGFRPIAVKECIGDRIPGAVDWNLFDIDAKFGDVESVDRCVDYLNTVNMRND